MTSVSEAVGDPTRDRLLSAAAEVFAEKGYDRAGVQEVARRAGFATGAIYGRFRGKADLLLAAIASQSNDEFDELFAEYRTKGLQGHATNILATIGSHLVTDEFDQGQALLLEAFVAARREPELAEMLRQVITEQQHDLGLLIDQAKSAGALDPEIDSSSVVRFCHALGLGFLLFGALDLDGPDPVPWDALIARFDAAMANPAGAEDTDEADEPDGGTAGD